MTLFYGHKPRILLGIDNSCINNATKIIDPEISQAFYATLRNNVAYYSVNQSENFNMYLDLSVPFKLPSKIENSFRINIYRLIHNKYHPIDTVKSSIFTPFYEEYGGDTYYQFHIIDALYGKGSYLIEILNPVYDGKYVLAIGKKEEFTFKDSINAIYSIYIIKTHFFNKNVLSIFEGKIMKTLLLFIIVVVFILILLYIFYRILSKR